MIIQRLFWTFLFCVSILGPLHSQEFPESWEGHWKGDLEIYRFNSLLDTVHMELLIEKLSADRWTFIIIYGKDEQRQERPYELLRLDKHKGLYQIDEKNGIALDAFYHQPCLYERFSVAGNMLSTQICLQGQHLHYEITFGDESPYAVTGDTILLSSDTIPEVKTFSIPSIQKAILSKQ